MALLKIRAHLRLVRTDGEDQVPDLEARPLRRARHQTRLPPRRSDRVAARIGGMFLLLVISLAQISRMRYARLANTFATR